MLALVLRLLERLKRWAICLWIGWSWAVESSTSGSCFKAFLLVTEEQRLAPRLEQHWELHLHLAVLPALGGAQELPSGLVGQPDQLSTIGTAEWTFQCPAGFTL